MHGKLASSPRMLGLRAKIGYRDFRLDIDAEIELERVTGLFGPSGSGKSTLLRVIAGLERNPGGSVSFGSLVWQTGQSFVPACQRPVGVVFQDARLFPHLTVAGNLRFAADRAPVADGHSRIEFADVVAALDLKVLLPRDVASLSGGERQRVAIARTLLSNPELLLLDEPLSALDDAKKQEIVPYIEKLLTGFDIPAIYVSHSVHEMARFADHVVLLDGGGIVGRGTAQEILGCGGSQSSSMSFETVSILSVRVVERLHDLHLVRVDHHGQTLTVPASDNLTTGEHIRLSIRASDVILANQKPIGLSVRNTLAGKVTSLKQNTNDAFAIVAVDVNGGTIKAQLTRQAVQELELCPGSSVYVLLKSASFDRGV